jgi:hypothetical protein
VSDIESISDCSEDDLARMESNINKRVVHDTTTGEVTINLPSDVPQKLTVPDACTTSLSLSSISRVHQTHGTKISTQLINKVDIQPFPHFRDI